MARRIAATLDGWLAVDGDALVISIRAVQELAATTAAPTGADQPGPPPR